MFQLECMNGFRTEDKDDEKVKSDRLKERKNDSSQILNKFETETTQREMRLQR